MWVFSAYLPDTTAPPANPADLHPAGGRGSGTGGGPGGLDMTELVPCTARQPTHSQQLGIMEVRSAENFFFFKLPGATAHLGTKKAVCAC